VCMITYNHEKYIGQAIEGVLLQKCNFSVELIIGEDCSTDKTRKICEEYQQKNNIIKLLPSEINLGIIPNFIRTLNSCSGKYIAICEGDDYWIDPLKLQKQVDYLENNTDYGMVCTDYNKFYQQTGEIKENCFKITQYKNEVKFEDYLLDRSTIGTATVMFRKTLYDSYILDIPEAERSSFNVGDTPMWLYFALMSRIGVLPDVTAVYRILGNSACHFTSPLQHYSFVMKGFEVPDYFISHFNVPENIKKLNEQKKIKATLMYAFKIRDKQKFKNSYNNIQALNLAIPIKFRLLRLGMLNKFFNIIINVILKLN
ncbi:MAG: glycosyltransferase, partial [Bacteroidales bacterium]|nr:glycosyltransferase [Bacteroidales bacterium]